MVAAHPDDEVLGRGRGPRDAGQPGAPGSGSWHSPTERPLTRTRAVHRPAPDRRNAAALAALGARHIEVIRLGLPDSGLAAHEHDGQRCGNSPAAFDCCLAPWDRDAHPDHEAAGRAARGCRRGEGTLWYPVWMWHWARPADAQIPWQTAVRVPLPPRVLARKRRAIGCFTSQLQDRGPEGPVLPAALVAHFIRDMEVLFQ